MTTKFSCIDQMFPYSKYKDSDVEWLGKISAHWKRLPGRVCYRETKSPNTGLKIDTVLSLSFGKIVIKPLEKLHGLVPTSFETYQLIEPNDIVIRPIDLQNDWNSLRFGLANTTGIITSAYICLRTSSVLTPQYGHLLLHTYDLKKIFYGLGSGLRQNLAWRDFKYLPCLVPPLPEQTAIVRYLDYLDRRIRRYIHARQKLIKLLEEQKQVVIHRAVTRGLDPDVLLKLSGVEWLRGVPEHWEVRRLGDSITNCINGSWGSDPNEIDDLPCVRVADFDRHSLRVRKPIPTIRAISNSERRGRILQSGDLLLEKSGGGDRQPVGIVILFDHDMPAVCSNFVSRMPVREGFDSGFLTFLHSALYSIKLNTRSIKQTTGIQNLDSAAYLNESVAFPPLPEQTAIVEYLDKTTADLDTAITRARRGIDLLQEYRTRLIADVVTGKLDVREAAAALPDEPVPLSG